MYTYMLDETGQPKLTNDLYEWARWYSHVSQESLRVAKTEIVGKNKVLVTVETKFSGQVERITDPPLVWATQAIGTFEIWRSSTREKAEENHRRMVRMLERKYRK